jgi:hypothetical protein
VFFALTLVNQRNLWAQSGTSSALAGVVTDAASSAVLHAEATATDIETMAARKELTNDDGRRQLAAHDRVSGTDRVLTAWKKTANRIRPQLISKKELFALAGRKCYCHVSSGVFQWH